MASDAKEDAPFWRLRRFVSGDRVHLAFGVCSEFSEMHRDLFEDWVPLRHYDHCQVRGDTDITTVGVLVIPRHGGKRSFETTMAAVRDELHFTGDELEQLRKVWPTQEDGVSTPGG